MAYTGKALELALPYLVAMSDKVRHFDTIGNEEKPALQMQARTQMEARELRAKFPGVVWKKAYDESCKWWEYTGTLDTGLTVHIYAVREAPPTCKAVYRTDVVTEWVPTAWTEEIVERQVIDHWDCNPESEDQP